MTIHDLSGNGIVPDVGVEPEPGWSVLSPSLAAPVGTGALRADEIFDLSVPAVWLLGREPNGTSDDMPAIQEYIDDSDSNRLIRFEGRANDYLAKTTLNIRGKHGLQLIGYNGGAIAGHSSLTKAVLSTWNAGDAASYTLGTGLMQQMAVNVLTGRVRPGQTVLPALNTIADALLYPAGSYIMLRCGNVTTGVPFCEMNKVYSVDTGTGIITLEWPSNWRYRDMGDGTDYGVALITNLVTERVRLIDLHVKHATFRPINLFHFVDFIVKGCTFQGLGAVGMRARHFDVEYRSILEGTWNANCRPYGSGIDAGSSNGRVKAIITSQGLAIVHIHESLANIEFDIDIQCGPTDAGPSEAWPVFSVKACTRNLHFKHVRIANAPGGGPAFASAQSVAYPGLGNNNLVIDALTIEGTVTTGRALDHETNQGVAVVKHLNTGGAVAGTTGTGAGPVGSSKLAKPITLIAAAGAAAASASHDGGSFWRCADAVAVGVQYEEDIPPGGWTHAELAIATENYDGGYVTGTATAGSTTSITLAVGSSATNTFYVGAKLTASAGSGIGQTVTITGYTGTTRVATFSAVTTAFDDTTVYNLQPFAVWLQRYRTAAAGTAVDYTGNQDTTLTLAYDGSGSPRTIRMVKALGRAGRVGFNMLRNGGGASDNLAGNADIETVAQLTYYIALGDADQAIQPVVKTNVGASSFATILAASTVGAIWEIRLVGPTNADYTQGVIYGGTTPVIVGAVSLGDIALAVNSTNIRVTNANAAAKLVTGSIVRIA